MQCLTCLGLAWRTGLFHLALCSEESGSPDSRLKWAQEAAGSAHLQVCVCVCPGGEYGQMNTTEYLGPLDNSGVRFLAKFGHLKAAA